MLGSGDCVSTSVSRMSATIREEARPVPEGGSVMLGALAAMSVSLAGAIYVGGGALTGIIVIAVSVVLLRK